MESTWNYIPSKLLTLTFMTPITEAISKEHMEATLMVSQEAIIMDNTGSSFILKELQLIGTNRNMVTLTMEHTVASMMVITMPITTVKLEITMHLLNMSGTYMMRHMAATLTVSISAIMTATMELHMTDKLEYTMLTLILPK